MKRLCRFWAVVTIGAATWQAVAMGRAGHTFEAMIWGIAAIYYLIVVLPYL